MKKKKRNSIIFIILIIILIVISYLFINSSYYKNKMLYVNPIKINQKFDKYVYDEYSNHIGIIFYEGEEKKVIIPNKINNKPIFSIDDSAFYGNSTVEEVVIPKLVIRIGHQTFIGNNKLKEVYLSDNIIDIGPYSFDVCPKLEKIYVKKGSKSEKALDKTKFNKYKIYK